MSLKPNDLKGVVTNEISIDEFEPKTGEKENIAVFGFYVTEKQVGEDLANFLEKSTFNFRDVEVTPNPNPDNLYMVFVEVDRDPGMIDMLREVAKDILNITGKVDWKGKPLLSDSTFDLDDPQLEGIVKSTPEDYVTKDEHEANMKQEHETSIKDFVLDNTIATAVELTDSIITIRGGKRDSVKLEVVSFGEGKPTLEEAGLNDLAIDYDFDRHLIKTMESMRGTLNILPINRNVVMHNPNTDQVLVVRPC
ncbi:hypothetical protein N9O93_01070 [bacterium]|jgi:hypothetical protein|nr:hypothetical protein [Hellea sp.]MDA9047673.1 hypothetical protein [Hellea sp.]MDA9225262.1 hypothetical protein [bacterium]